MSKFKNKKALALAISAAMAGVGIAGVAAACAPTKQKTKPTKRKEGSSSSSGSTNPGTSSGTNTNPGTGNAGTQGTIPTTPVAPTNLGSNGSDSPNSSAQPAPGTSTENAQPAQPAQPAPGTSQGSTNGGSTPGEQTNKQQEGKKSNDTHSDSLSSSNNGVDQKSKEDKKITLLSFRKNGQYIDMEFKVKKELYDQIKDKQFYLEIDWNTGNGISIIEDKSAIWTIGNDQSKKIYNNPTKTKVEDGYVTFSISTEQGDVYYGKKGTYKLSKITLLDQKNDDLLSSNSNITPIKVE